MPPADGRDPLPLLDRIGTISPWAAGTDDDGPLGPLVAVGGAERSTLTATTYDALAGVLATGEYRFLDLPGYAGLSLAPYAASDDLGVDQETIALAPDGRHLAYAYRDDDAGPADGVALYDTVSGEVRRHDVGAPYGVVVVGAAWAGSAALLVEYQTYDAEPDASGSSSTGAAPLVWEVDEDAPVATRNRPLGLDAATTSDQGLVVSDGTRTRVVAADGSVLPGPRLPEPAAPGSVVVSPGGSRLAWTPRTDADGALLVAEPEDPDGTVRRVGAEHGRLLGWRDDGHVVAGSLGNGLYSVDVGSGAVEQLVRFDAHRSVTAPLVVAADALRGPVVAGPDPGWALDQRLALLAAVVVVLAGVVLVLVRSRRRARLG